MDILIKVTDEEEKVLRHELESPEEWIANAIREKAERCMDRAIEKHTNKRASALDRPEKLDLIRQLTLQPRSK